MKLGTETGSLANHLYSRHRHPNPTVGMAATLLHWTDRHAATVIDVQQDGNFIAVQEDNAKRIDANGMSENQEYATTPDSLGTVYFFRRKDPDCNWKNVRVTVGKNGRVYYKRADSAGLVLGRRDHYHDFTF